MLRLIKPDYAPIGGYRFVDPDTNYPFKQNYPTFEQLEAAIIQYRNNNKLPPIEELRSVWENWMCQQPGMKSKCCGVTAQIARNFEQYMKGALAWVKTAVKKEKFVAQEVAETRAKCCAECNQNVRNIGHSHSQYYTDSWMRSQVGNRTTTKDADLLTCKICTCILRSKVHYADSTVKDSLTATELVQLKRLPKNINTGQPIKCWQVSLGEK